MNDLRVVLALCALFLVFAGAAIYAMHQDYRYLETQRALCEQHEGVLLTGPSGHHCVMLECLL